MTNYPWMDEYLLAKPGVEKDFKEEWQWYRYRIRDKMFAATCTPDLKYKPYDGRSLVNLKCDPGMAELLRKTYPDVIPGFYCDKRTWNSVYLDGAVPDDALRQMLDDAYQLIFEKLPKKLQKEIADKGEQ